MAKKIKESRGLIISWNRTRKYPDDITLFVRYKDIISSYPIKLWDIGHHLVKAIKKIEKEEAKNKNVDIIKKRLAIKYISNPKQKEIFLNKATQFKQWANYIAGLVLTQNEKKIFTPKDVRKILKEHLIPDYYNKPGFQVSSLLTADLEKDSSWHNECPFLERVSRGEYKFIGFRKNKK